MTCPRCGAEASGNFCSTCGASLKQNPCPTCGATPEPGARFCNNCGAALGAARGAGGATAGAAGGGTRGGGASRARAAAAGGGEATAAAPSRAGWWVAGVFFVGIILIVALPILRRESPPETGTAPAAGAPGVGTPPDLSTMTPRQAADRLFERVMRAASSGNNAEVQQFMPMALAAYEQAQPLDLDGLFHLALLHQTNGEHAAASAIANSQILAENPNYLLGLSVAAEAALALGDSAAARQHYTRFLEAYDSEMARGLEEYGGHSVVITQTRQDAVAFTSP